MDVIGDFPDAALRLELRRKFIETGKNIVAGFGA
jgi:hypothetical protein